ncbi:MAG TPA: hypothetical protein VH370_03580 [Humisphaera sp.]|jgi:hypothetical protein|nr:hypothetical protein [Humisphaera sp.]
MKVYDEIIDLIATSRPEMIANFQVSPEAKEHVADLLSREKNGGLTPDETSELNDYMEFEHIMRLVKARARQLLTQ